jgi:chromosome segregation ATPase
LCGLDLIMKGKDSARTQIVLLNKGCIDEEKYGEEVSIERTISKSGSSTYRIRADNSKWRPLKRSELDYILISFNIQLDNPVAILNQEIAKNFLRTKDPKDKYELCFVTLFNRSSID